jgi:hypothetical protein
MTDVSSPRAVFGRFARTVGDFARTDRRLAPPKYVRRRAYHPAVDGPRIRPTLRRVVSTDYAALVGVIVPCVGVALWIANAFFGFPGRAGRPPLPPNHPLFVILGTVSLLAGAIVVTSRRRYVDALFASGDRTPGTITSVRFLKDRGRIEFTYESHGQHRQSVNTVHRTRRTAGVRPLQRVTVLVDPIRPANAIVLDLYV